MAFASRPFGADCTCPTEERSLGRLYGMSMGRGMVRLGTTPGCPEHDTCRGYTKARRANLRATRPSWAQNPWCPIHHNRPCPEAPDGVR